jgi:hypothetical protein
VVGLVDVRLFNIYVQEKGVRKGYDWLILPDGRRVSVAPGKYMRIAANSFGFEDLTEEIGERPDYDYDEPYCTIVEDSGFISKRVVLKCKLGIGGRKVDLYYGDKLIASNLSGYKDNVPIEFTYTSMSELLGVAAAAGAAVLALLALRKRRTGK